MEKEHNRGGAMKTTTELNAEISALELARFLAKANGYTDLSRQAGEELNALCSEREQRRERNTAQILEFKKAKREVK